MKYISNIRSLFSFFTEKYLVNKLIKKFITPQKFSASEREMMFCKSAKQITMFIPSINKKIIVYEYGYSKSKCLLIHGWSGRGSQFYALADKLLENGRMVVSFDAPAHGNSIGKYSSMEEFVKIIEFLNNKYNFDIAVGHSIGAMALLFSTANGSVFNKIVSIAATNNIEEILRKFLVGNNSNINLISKFKKRFITKYKTDLEVYNGEEFAKKIKIPTLIIHDSQDQPADVSSAYEIRQHLEKGEILVSYNLGHTRILKNNKINNHIINFIKNV